VGAGTRKRTLGFNPGAKRLPPPSLVTPPALPEWVMAVNDPATGHAATLELPATVPDFAPAGTSFVGYVPDEADHYDRCQHAYTRSRGPKGVDSFSSFRGPPCVEVPQLPRPLTITLRAPQFTPHQCPRTPRVHSRVGARTTTSGVDDPLQRTLCVRFSFTTLFKKTNLVRLGRPARLNEPLGRPIVLTDVPGPVSIRRSRCETWSGVGAQTLSRPCSDREPSERDPTAVATRGRRRKNVSVQQRLAGRTIPIELPAERCLSFTTFCLARSRTRRVNRDETAMAEPITHRHSRRD